METAIPSVLLLPLSLTRNRAHILISLSLKMISQGVSKMTAREV